MATTTGAMVAMRVERPPLGLSLRVGRRLRVATAAITAYVTGHRLPPSLLLSQRPPAAPPRPPVTQLERITGPLGPVAMPAPVRPGPLDKPLTLAHYQAMAEQAAQERRRTDADGRRQAAEPGVGIPREIWFPHPTGQHRNGVRPHG